MSLHRTKATIIGLLETERVNEWVVTEKLGNTAQPGTGFSLFRRPRFRFNFHLGDRYAHYLCQLTSLSCNFIRYPQTVLCLVFVCIPGSICRRCWWGYFCYIVLSMILPTDGTTCGYTSSFSQQLLSWWALARWVSMLPNETRHEPRSSTHFPQPEQQYLVFHVSFDVRLGMYLDCIYFFRPLLEFGVDFIGYTAWHLVVIV